MKHEALIALAVALIALSAITAHTLRLRPRRRTLNVEITMGDITTQHVDVIVNAAKKSLLGGGGVDGAIHKAGGPAILRECRALRAMEYPNGLTEGDAVATTAGDMDAQYVVHTVGPVYDKHAEGDRSAILRSCYARSLVVADSLGAQTIAFPLISAGVYGWPVGDAVRQAIATLAASSCKNITTARLVLFDEAAFDMAVAALRTLKAR